MASLEALKKTQAPKADPRREEEDLRLTLMLGVKLLEQGGGMQTIGEALGKSSDPAQVVGQVLSQILMSLAEQGVTGLNIVPQVFLRKGGWLEAMLDYIESSLNLPKEFSNQVFGSVVEFIKAATQAAQKGKAGGGQPMPPQQAQPPMPPQGGQPGMMPQGGGPQL